MRYTDKQTEFIDWVCGIEGAKFPFFRENEMPNVEEPKMPVVGLQNPKYLKGVKEQEIAPKNETQGSCICSDCDNVIYCEHPAKEPHIAEKGCSSCAR